MKCCHRRRLDGAGAGSNGSSFMPVLAAAVTPGGLLCSWEQRAHNCQSIDTMFISDRGGDHDPGALYHLSSQNTAATKPQKLNAF